MPPRPNRQEVPGDRPDAAALLAIAQKAARAGGRRTLESFGRRLASETKPDGTPVTDADRASEAAIRAVLARARPQDGFTGEESGIVAGASAVHWIVDPLDGTKSFIHGVPLYAVLVAAEVRGIPTVGVIHLPALDEMVSAARGVGCRWNGRRAQVSTIDRLSEATVLTTSVRGIEAHGLPFRRIARASRLQRGWGDGYGYAMVATGRAEVMIDAAVLVWDAAPLLPILEEAGGRFTDWKGRATIRGADAVGSNGHVHEEIVRLLRDARIPSGRRPAPQRRSRGRDRSGPEEGLLEAGEATGGSSARPARPAPAPPRR
ncbi:MAG: inositol monophosphatase family protein [Thermoplasmata archaeon]